MPTAGGFARFVADWGYLLDPLSSVMILLVAGISLLVGLYSLGFMSHEEGYYRYFGLLNLFLSSLLVLVLANNLLLLFVGWEGVSLCSYLLISFHFSKKSAASAGSKAFLFNRIGDAGFLLGMFLVATTLGTVRFTSQGVADASAFPGIAQRFAVLLDQHVLAFGAPVLTAITLLLFAGAVTKAAQIPFSVWLLDATEAPIPAGALLHSSATLAAGLYLIARMNAVYQLAPIAMEVIAIVGAITAIYAA